MLWISNLKKQNIYFTYFCLEFPNSVLEMVLLYD